MATDELTKLIDTLVEQKTFGLDALGPIKDLRDKAARQETALNNANNSILEYRRDMAAKDAEISRLQSDINDWSQRQAEMENRERKVFDLEKASAVAVAKSEVWGDAFHSIFKNTIVRETINRDVPLVRGYSSSGGGDVVERHQARTVVDRDTE